jgi:hypothetical protein
MAAAAEEPSTFNVDAMIQQLVAPKAAGKGAKQVTLNESDIHALCDQVKGVFMEQPMLLELNAPIKIVGDVRTQLCLPRGRHTMATPACCLPRTHPSILGMRARLRPPPQPPPAGVRARVGTRPVFGPAEALQFRGAPAGRQLPVPWRLRRPGQAVA